MIFGQSKDLGECRSTNKAGEKCRAIVNINKCEFCIYHVKKEYQKHSIGRSELQSSFAGKGLTALRNKVLGKNEVFYAGKSYTALPAKKSKKLVAKDEKRLASLSNMNVTVNVKPTVMSDNGVKKKQFAQRLDSSYCQKAKDLKLLEKLGTSTSLYISLTLSTSLNFIYCSPALNLFYCIYHIYFLYEELIFNFYDTYQIFSIVYITYISSYKELIF